MVVVYGFFFKQKTAYEVRISDWSSDVCSSDLLGGSEAQKARWLPRLASGEVLATVAFAEGKSVWFPGEWQLAGADGSLTGVKTLVPNAAEADLMEIGRAHV